MDAQMKRGFLEACVLATIDRRESYGYQIVKDVPLTLGLTESTLYPLLKRLEAAQCIAVRTAEHNGRLRKYYRITEAGRQRIAEFVAERPEVLAIYDYIEAATGRGSTAQQVDAEAAPSPELDRSDSPVRTCAYDLDYDRMPVPTEKSASQEACRIAPQSIADAPSTRSTSPVNAPSAAQPPFPSHPATASSI